jgi:hypothetical protein
VKELIRQVHLSQINKAIKIIEHEFSYQTFQIQSNKLISNEHLFQNNNADLIFLKRQMKAGLHKIQIPNILSTKRMTLF